MLEMPLTQAVTVKTLMEMGMPTQFVEEMTVTTLTPILIPEKMRSAEMESIMTAMELSQTQEVPVPLELVPAQKQAYISAIQMT